ncbi:hypothetical protein N7533_007890 [Penicillium manginii]|uniref:uncharacterized protein n=1 Tax=Penicillium manginii TaxID=203109 RepID=UPI002549B38F|nr:uncharacterized protein N7533_007890 [Penicillium manginii]KAJ5750862.1 hypothetical protein N7533_007890 [Penicillium manginii]
MATVDAILAAKYPGKAHARRVAQALKAQDAGAIYLEAQKTRLIEDNDEAMPFRQRRPFFYLTGCPEPDASMVYDIKADELTLFIPPIDPDSVIWSGLPLSLEEAANLYDVDHVQYTTDVNSTLSKIASAHAGKTVAFSIGEQVSQDISFAAFASSNSTDLKKVIDDARVVKDAYEVALLRKANDISTKGHIAIAKAARAATNERELEAAWLAGCIANGCREQSYHPIFAGGANGATLHYVKNDEFLVDQVTKLRKGNLLIDAGGEYRTYCADITRVVPLNGTFPAETRAIYEIVLRMQDECIAMLKEGVRWDDVHAHAHRVAIRGLLDLGILRGEEEELFVKRVSVAFFPHGLGHYLGMDTHDTGGYPNYADEDKMFRYLRIYFCRFIIDPVLNDPETGKYIDAAVLERYWNVGGVRIEDNIHITKDGHDNLTSAPKAIAEIEALAQ